MIHVFCYVISYLYILWPKPSYTSVILLFYCSVCLLPLGVVHWFVCFQSILFLISVKSFFFFIRAMQFLLFWLRIVGDVIRMKLMKRLVDFAIPYFLSFHWCILPKSLNFQIIEKLGFSLVIGAAKWDCLDSSSGPSDHRSCVEWKQVYFCWQDFDWRA